MPMTTAQQTDAYRFFVIAFGAAPGVTYMNQLADAYDSGMTTKAVVNAFVSKDVFKAQYPSFLTNEQFAETLVTNVVGDAATAAAKTEAQTQIVAALASGMSRGDVIFNVFNNIASKPATDAMWGTLSTKLANQVAYAKYYTETLRGDTTTVATLQNVVKNVTATSDVTAAGISAVLNPPVAPVSQTFTLTTGVDTTLVGGAGADTYNASGTTLTSGDILSGGAGTDSLNITTTAAAPALGTGVVSTGVETVNVTATVGAAVVDATNFAGVTTVGSTGSTADVTINNLAAIPAVNVTATSNNVTVGIAAAAVVGTADSATINLNGVATGAAGNTISINGIETLNINSTGTGSGSATATVTIDGAASPNLTTVNLTGTAAAKVGVTLGGATTTTTGTITSDAGAHDVAVTADTTDKISISMGAGNDTVRLGTIAPALATGSTTSGAWTIAGGEGTDTLRTSGAITSATGSNISGFESVRIDAAVAVTLSTTTNTISAATLATGSTLTGLAAGATVTQAAGGSATVANTAWTTPTTDSLTINVGAADLAGALTQSLTATGIDTAVINNLNIGSDITSARSVGVSSANLTALTVNGAQPTTITGGGAALRTLDVTGVSNDVTATGVTFAAAGASITSAGGNDTITAGTGNDTITSGSGNDNITAGTGNDVVTAGDGNDTINLGTGNDSVDGGAGNDSITAGEGADTMTGGAGADTFIVGGPNTVLASFSTAAATDVITDFVSGTDKITVGQTVSSFVGNYATLQLGLANTTGNDQAFFVTGENQLYVIATKANGYVTTDTVVKLTGVTSVTKEDLGFGAQGTGNSVTATAATAPIINTTSSNAVSSTLTTTLDDTITVGAATALVGTNAAINGGAGRDTLNASLAIASLATLDLGTAGTIGTGDTSGGLALTNVEVVNLTVTDEAGGALTVTAVPTTVESLTVNGANASLAATVTAAGQVFTVNNTQIGGNGSTITFGAFATQSATTGSSDDTFETIAVDGITVNGGAGNDVFKISNVAAVDNDNTILSITGGTGTADEVRFANALTITADFTDSTDVAISGVEVVDAGTVGGASEITLSSGFTTLKGTTTNGNITYKMTAAQLDAVTTVTSGAAGNTFSIATTDTTGPVTVNLADTTYTTLANVDSITFNSVTTGVVSVTIDENVVVVGGQGTADVLTVTANINATLGASAFETVKFTTAAQTAAVTLMNDATAAETSKGGVFVLGTGGDTFTNNADAAVTVTGGTGADTIAHASSSALRFVASAGGDTLNATGTGAVTFFGNDSTGIHTINLNASNAAADSIYLTSAATTGTAIVAAADRVVVTGFSSGLDKIYFDVDKSTAATANTGTAVIQAVATAPTAGVTFDTATADILMFNFDLGGSAEVLAGVLTGSALLANLGQTVSVAADQNLGYIVAYDNGKAYIYAVVESNDGGAALAAADITLVGIVTAEVGSLGSGQFIGAGG